MNARGKPGLADRLAAEYVLGTLRGLARTRFEAWLREDGELRARVDDWQAKLAPLAAAAAPIAPPARVWRAIEQRIDAPRDATAAAAAPATGAARTAAAPPWWQSLGFWRGWGLVASGCAAALAVAMWVRPVIEVERVVVKTTPASPAYVAVLRDANGDVAFIARAERKSSELWVKRMAMAPLSSGQGYELWGVPAKPGMPPRSLGMIPPGATGTIKLAAAADESLVDFPQLAISVEPAGGSPSGQPSGAVMYKGDCHRFW